MSLKEIAIRLPIVQSYSRNKKDRGGPTESFNVNWTLKYIIPGIKCERIRDETKKEKDWDGEKGEYRYKTYLYYIDDDEEVKRIKKAYANYDNLPDWNECGYDEEAYDKVDKEFNELSDTNYGTPSLGSNFGIAFDCANNDKYVSSFKSYLIERYMRLEEIVQSFQQMNKSQWDEDLSFEEVRDTHIQLCRLWIERDKIMYKEWALKMQGFDLDEWELENAEWIKNCGG